MALRSPISVSWVDRLGTPKFSQARTLDVSEIGIRIELPEPLEPRTVLGLRSEKLGLSSTGSVRTCVRCAAKYVVGVEFTQQVRLKSLESAGA